MVRLLDMLIYLMLMDAICTINNLDMHCFPLHEDLKEEK